VRRILLVLTTLALGLAFAISPAAGPLLSRSNAATGDQKVAVFEDVTIGPDDSWDTVVVVGGDVIVRGEVRDAIVVVGGDIVVGRGAVIGTHVDRSDASIVSVFGRLVVDAGATVRGETVDVAGGLGDIDGGRIVDPFLKPWRLGSVISWISSTVGLAVIGLIIAAVAPRQLSFVRGRLRRRFFSSLGWGALALIIVVPLVTALMIVTIIGVLALIPWLVAVIPVITFFGLTALGALVGGSILRRESESRTGLMALSVLGLVIVNLAWWIPVGGAIILALLTMAGFGATIGSMYVWLRERRRRRRQLQPPEAG